MAKMGQLWEMDQLWEMCSRPLTLTLHLQTDSEMPLTVEWSSPISMNQNVKEWLSEKMSRSVNVFLIVGPAILVLETAQACDFLVTPKCNTDKLARSTLLASAGIREGSKYFMTLKNKVA